MNTAAPDPSDTMCAHCGSLNGGHTLACQSIHADSDKPAQIPAPVKSGPSSAVGGGLLDKATAALVSDWNLHGADARRMAHTVLRTTVTGRTVSIGQTRCYPGEMPEVTNEMMAQGGVIPKRAADEWFRELTVDGVTFLAPLDQQESARHILLADKADSIFSLTALERAALDALLMVAYTAWNLADNTEETDDGRNVDTSDYLQLSEALDRLAELPDDQPGYTMSEAAKARWALRRLIGEAAIGREVSKS